jgi:hypothetical protein
MAAGLLAGVLAGALHGFAMAAPFLPPWASRTAQRATTVGPILVFAALWFPPVHTALFDAAQWTATSLGLNPLLFLLGQEVFMGWASA